MAINSNIPCRPNPSGDWPIVDATAYVDPTAVIIGNVCVGPRVFVGPGAVLRADETGNGNQVEPIRIGAECNVQDGVIIHALAGTEVTIGRRTSLAHGCIIHGPCRLGDGCFIGFRAVLFDVIAGDGVFVDAGAVVQAVNLLPNTFVPSGRSVVSAQQTAELELEKTSSTQRCFVENVVATNLTLAKGYIGLKK